MNLKLPAHSLKHLQRQRNVSAFAHGTVMLVLFAVNRPDLGSHFGYKV